MDQQLPPPNLPLTPRPTTAQLVEALLFVAGEPVAIAQLAKALEVPPDAIEAALDELASQPGRGVCVQRLADRVQLVSVPGAAAVIERFLGVQASTRLSAAALETLAIIAYRQPITRAQIDAIRGVDSGGVVRALLARELVAEAGRLETVGRPILYVVTDQFMRQFGLTNLAELPLIDMPQIPAEQP